MHKLLVATGAVVLSLGAALATEGEAKACSAPAPVPWFAPPTGETIPANAPALVYSGPDPASPSLPGFDLVVERDGAEWLYRPNKAFLPGSEYTVSFTDGSPNSWFGAGPASALPTRLGTIATDASTRERLVVGTSSGSCSAEVDAAVVHLTITPSDELRPWLAITRFTATVDGTAFATSRYGSVTLPPPLPSAPVPRNIATIFARCASTDDYADKGVAPGHHTLTIAAHVAGAATDPTPASTEFDLNCDAPPAGKTDATPAGNDAVADDTVVGGCTCELATEQLANHAPLGLAGVVIAVGIVRRRRRLTHQ